MTYLSPGELNIMQADANVLLTDTAIISRPTDVSDGQGGFDRSWKNVGTVIARLEPYSRAQPDTEEGDAPHPQAQKIWMVLTPAVTDIRTIDRVLINGLHLEVAGVRSPRSEQVLTRTETVELDA